MITNMVLESIPFEQNQAMNFEKINFIFGQNGTGKTTLSSLIGSVEYLQSHTQMADVEEYETIVFNRNFIKDTFQNDTIPGIFTLGRDRIEIQSRIANLDADLKFSNDEIKNLKVTKQKVADGAFKRENEFIENCWSLARSYRTAFSGALTGYKQKLSFASKCKEFGLSAKSNETLESITLDIKRAFNSDFDYSSETDRISTNEIYRVENADVWKERIVSDGSDQLGELLRRLNNSDWVYQGIAYIDEATGKCPFCQQAISLSIRSRLKDYFNAEYRRKISSIEEMRNLYERLAVEIENTIYKYLSEDISGFDSDNLTQQYRNFILQYQSNIELMIRKKKEPSNSEFITSTEKTLKSINDEIIKRNEQIKANNELLDDKGNQQKRITERAFKLICFDVLRSELVSYYKFQEGNRKAILKIDEKLDTLNNNKERFEKQRIILEKQFTNIHETAEQMQKLLLDFGYNSFQIATTDDGRKYKLIRPDGSAANETLSDGEYRLLTFIYFYSRVFGSLSSTIASKKKIIVIDDPICSLDNQAVYLVLGLCHQIIEQCKQKKNNLEQVIILSHNAYFLRQLIEPYMRGRETNVKITVLLKENETTKITQSRRNIILSTYESMWSSILNTDTNNYHFLLNTMRRVIDDFFENVIGRDKWKFYDKMQEKDKPTCRALLTAMNAGSHIIEDDFDFTLDASSIENLKAVFKSLFEVSGYIDHYNMMEDKCQMKLGVCED